MISILRSNETIIPQYILEIAKNEGRATYSQKLRIL